MPTPPDFLDKVALDVRSRDPQGEADIVFDVGTGSRWLSVKLWPGAELRVWLVVRRIRGDKVVSNAVGVIPDIMVPLAGEQVMDGVRSGREVDVLVLARSMNLLREFIVAEARFSDASVHEILVGLFHRSDSIEKALVQIAREPHEGNYKSLAFQAVVLSAPGREFARSALRLPGKPQVTPT